MALAVSVWLPELDSDGVAVPLGEPVCELVLAELPLPDGDGVFIPLGVLEPEPDGVNDTEGDSVPLIDALCERVAAAEGVPEPVGVRLVLWDAD